jgi:hypothetical protein
VRSKPKWALSEVKALVADGCLLVTQRACEWYPTQSEAVLAVSEVIGALSGSNFAHNAVLANHVADVYGVVLDGRGWYLKLSVTEDVDGRVVVVISFHPLERALRTRGGLVIP